MAYMSQERKRELAPQINAVCKKYGVKARLGVRHYSTLELNITSAPFDMIAHYNEGNDQNHIAKGTIQVNVYHYERHFVGKTLDFLKEVIPLMYIGNHDNSDIQTDYFDVGWYVNVNIGKWDKPFVVTGE